MRSTKWHPKKSPKTDKEVETFMSSLAIVMMDEFGLNQYKLFVLMPGEPDWHESKDASMSVRVAHPSKKIFLSIQKDSIEKAKKTPTGQPLWDSVVHGMIHEMVHVILWDLVEVARTRCITIRELDDMEESTTDHLANVIHNLLTLETK